MPRPLWAVCCLFKSGSLDASYIEVKKRQRERETGGMSEIFIIFLINVPKSYFQYLG